MSLSSIIKSNAAALAAAESGDWQACAEALNAKNIEVRDASLVTYDRLSQDFGDAARQLVAGTIRGVIKQMDAAGSPLAGELQDAHAVLLNRALGLDLSLDSRQAIIDQLAAAGAWPDSLRDAIKAKGVRLVSLADQNGLSEVDAVKCAQAWAVSVIESRWVSCLNDRGINAALATGDTAALVAALRESANWLESV